jgi:hypothetical protein
MNDDFNDTPDEFPTVDAAQRALADALAEAAALAPPPRAVCRCGAGPHATVPNRCAAGHAIAGNQFRKDHVVDERKREAILNRLLSDYAPSTTLLRSSCEHLASILEQLAVRKPGTPEHQRLVQLSQVLGNALEASSPRAIRFTSMPDLVALSKDELIARTTALLRSLLQSSQSKTPASSTGEDHSRASNAPGADPRAVPDTRALETVTPQPERCVYCSLSPAQCAEIKVTRRETWQVLHYDDPACIAERSADATATMHRNIGKRSPWM